MSKFNYDDVTDYSLEPDLLEEILRKQIECTFIWGPKDHWAVGVLMTYIWKDGSFWVSATSQRKRIPAIKRDPRVSIVVSSHGTDLGPAKGITAKGRAIIHDDQAIGEPLCPLHRRFRSTVTPLPSREGDRRHR